MSILDDASLVPHLDGSCGVTWVEREGDRATLRTQQFATRLEAEVFARSLGLEPAGADMALALASQFKSEAFAAARSEDWPGAEEQARAVLRINPDDGDLHRLLGVVLLKQDRLEESISELEAAVRLLPSDGAAHHNLGVDYALQGRRAEAIAAFEAAAAAGMSSAVGSDLLELLRAAGDGPDDDPFTVGLTQTAVRHYLRSRG